MQEKQYDIDELLVKYMLGEADNSETTFVQEWVKKDAANQKYFEDFKQIWEKSKSIQAQYTVNENAAWERFQKRISTTETPSGKVSRMWWLRMVAILVLFLGVGTLAYIFLLNTNERVNVESFASVVNRELPDGSQVTLNKNSSISFPEKFRGDKREVELKGEAFFDVESNKEKPFIIHVDGAKIRVVGTSFNVKTFNGNTEVIVESGIVQVEKDGKVVELRASESILIKKDGPQMEKEVVADKLHNYYRSKEFVCENTPLWKLVEVLNEAYGVNIVIANNELKSLPLTTTFNNESLDQVLNVISQTFNIEVVRSVDRIELK